MKLGVNLFSVRKFLKNEADVRESFRKIRDIGYEVVQLSGAAPMPAETVRKISRESGLPIVCTHSPLDRILHDTDALIRDTKPTAVPSSVSARYQRDCARKKRICANGSRQCESLLQKSARQGCRSPTTTTILSSCR